MIILGYLNTDNFSIPINTILMITKQYIFNVSLNLERRPSIYELKDLIKKNYFEQSLVAKINDCEDKFNTKWLKFSDVFNGIK